MLEAGLVGFFFVVVVVFVFVFWGGGVQLHSYVINKTQVIWTHFKPDKYKQG